MNTAALLTFALVALAVLGATFAVVTVVAKAVRGRRERALAGVAAAHRMLLLEVASGEDDGSARSALAALGPRQWRSVRPTVFVMLRKVRGVPAEQLVALLNAHEEVRAARAQLHSRSAITRARAAHLLGVAADVDSLPQLAELLKDSDRDVRLAAVRALGVLGEANYAAAILDAVPGRHGGVGLPVWLAAETLLSLGPGIAPAVESGLTAADPSVRMTAARVAGELMLPGALGLVRECLHFEREPDVKEAMLEALGQFGRPEDVGLVVGYAGRFAPRRLRHTAIRVLGELGGPAATERLVALLADGDRGCAAAAATALSDMGDTGLQALDEARRLAQIGEQEACVARVVSAALSLARLRAPYEAAVT